MEEFVNNYVNNLKQVLDKLPREKIKKVADLLMEARAKDKKIFLMGNGGSAATASHMSCDLSKGTIVGDKKRFKVISLNDDIPLMTAWGNDEAFEKIFQEELQNLLEEGDVVLGITASGDSPDILKAIEYANSKNAVTVGLIGFGGGKLKELVNESVIVDSNSYQEVEDIHLILEHMITSYLKSLIEKE